MNRSDQNEGSLTWEGLPATIDTLKLKGTAHGPQTKAC